MAPIHQKYSHTHTNAANKNNNTIDHTNKIYYECKTKTCIETKSETINIAVFFLSLSLLLIQITCNICNIVDDGLLSVVCAILRIYGTNKWQSFLVKLIQLRYKMCAAYLFFIKGKANSYMFSIELFSTVIWNARIFFSPNYVQ